MSKRELYAVIGDYAFLAEQIDNRRDELGIGVDDLDHRADLADRFASKACGPSQSAKWGLSTPGGNSNGAGKPGTLFRVLEALGLRLALIEDAKLTQAARDGSKRQENHVRERNYSSRVSRRIFSRVQRDLAKRGGKARWADKSAAERSAHSRMMILKWNEIRKAANDAAKRSDGGVRIEVRPEHQDRNKRPRSRKSKTAPAGERGENRDRRTMANA